MYVLVGSSMLVLGKGVSVGNASAIENSGCIEGWSQSHLTRPLAFLRAHTADRGVWRRIPRSLSFGATSRTTVRISSTPDVHDQHSRKHHISRGGNILDRPRGPAVDHMRSPLTVAEGSWMSTCNEATLFCLPLQKTPVALDLLHQTIAHFISLQKPSSWRLRQIPSPRQGRQ